MAFFTLVQGSVFVTSATNLPSSTPVQILEKGVQGPQGTSGGGTFPIVANPAVLGTTPAAASLSNGMIAYVVSRSLHYKYDSTSGVVADGTDIIVANGGVGRWFSTPIVALQPLGVAGQVLTNGGPGVNPSWVASAGGPPSGAAGGDLTGTYPNPTVRAITMQGTTDFLAQWTAPAPLGVKGDFEIHAQDSSGADAGGNVTIRSGAATTIPGFGGDIYFIPGNDGTGGTAGDTRLMKGANIMLMMDGSALGGSGKMMFGGTGPQAGGIGFVPATVGPGKLRDDRTQRATPGSGQAGGDWNHILGRSEVGAPIVPAFVFGRETEGSATPDISFSEDIGIVPPAILNGTGALEVYNRGNFAIQWPSQSDPGQTGGSLLIQSQQGGVGVGTLGGDINIASHTGGLASGAINLKVPFGGDGNTGTVNFVRGTNALLTMTGLASVGFFQFGGLAGTLVPGFRQVQSTTTGGMQREDRTQAAFAGSGLPGGVYQFIIGKRDGAATPAEFRFGHETVAASAFTNGLAIRPPATISSGTSLRVQDSNAFDILYNTISAGIGSAPLSIVGQANSNPAGTGGFISIIAGSGTGGAISGTLQLSSGSGAAGGRIDLAEGGAPGMRFQGGRFNGYSTLTNMGTGQDQAGAGVGSARQERTQASAAASGLSGGDYRFTHGRNDGAGLRGSFLYECETVAGGASSTAYEIRMEGTTVNSGLTLYKYGTTGDYTIGFLTNTAAGAAGALVLTAQRNLGGPGGVANLNGGRSDAAGAGGAVEITAGEAVGAAFVGGAVNIHGATHATGTGGGVLIEGGDSIGVPGANVRIRPGTGTVDGDVAFYNGLGTLSKIRYDGANNRIESAVPYCGDPDAAGQAFRFGYIDIVAVAGVTVLTAAQNANGVLLASGTPGAAFTWTIAAELGQVKFIRNDTPSVMTVLAAGGGAGLGAVTLAGTSHGLFMVVFSGGFSQTCRIN